MCSFINPDVLLHTLVSRMCYSKIHDVLFQDKIQDVLFQGTGCAIPRYRMCYSKISVILVLITQNMIRPDGERVSSG